VNVVPFDSSYAVTRPYTLREAEEYCRRLATSHYENFLVATVFLPKALSQHFFNIYAFCRIADDLGDESPTSERALQLLDWWERSLRGCYDGQPDHPVFVALQRTNEMFGIPITPYLDLLRAFRRDQVQSRYDTYEELLDYCKCSANPVGHLVLHLFGYTDAHRRNLSDATCTALQLVNFWQDVVPDYGKGRIYLPRCDRERFGITEEQIAERRFNASFAALMELECSRAAELLDYGLGLCSVVPKRLAIDVAMFSQGGREVLRRIAAQGYDVLGSRPAIPKARQATLLAGTALRVLFRGKP